MNFKSFNHSTTRGLLRRLPGLSVCLRPLTTALSRSLAALVAVLMWRLGLNAQTGHTNSTYTYPISFSLFSYGLPKGVASFYRDKDFIYGRGGGAGGGRGFNTAILDTNTLEYVPSEFHNFDTWADTFETPGGSAHYQFVDYLRSITNGTLVMLAVCDEAGLNAWPPSQCVRLTTPGVSEVVSELKTNGSTLIDSYCYNGAWGMIFVKGSPTPIVEGVLNYDWINNQDIAPVVDLHFTLLSTSQKPVLSVTAQINDFGNTVYSLTLTNLVIERDVEVQYSEDLLHWLHLRTLNQLLTNWTTFTEMSLGLSSRFFRAVPDNATVLLPP